MMNATIYKRGNRYYVHAYWDERGRRRQHKKGGFKTEGEARRYRNAFLAKGANPLFAAPNRTTVDAWCDRFLDLVERQDRKKATTVRDYTSTLETWVRPFIGSMRLQDVRPLDCDEIFAAMIDAGRSDATIRKVYRVASRAFRVAVMKGLLDANPFERASVPTGDVPSGHREAWRAEELEIFFRAIAGHRFEALFVLAATTGLRRGELCGLHWDDIDLDEGRLTVHRAHTQLGRQIIVDTPKSRAGGRVVRLDEGTVAILRRHRADQHAQRLVVGPAWNAAGLVFCDGDGETLLPATVSGNFKRIVAGLDVPKIPLHGLRHTSASILIRAGARPAMVSKRLGHSKTSFTMNVYVHDHDDDQDEATAVFSSLVPPRKVEAR
jgi:integrase